ncbi:hypothetical protein Dimus_018315 [Dionaea muscipula]
MRAADSRGRDSAQPDAAAVVTAMRRRQRQPLDLRQQLPLHSNGLPEASMDQQDHQWGNGVKRRKKKN